VRVQIHGLVRQLRQGRALNPERTRSAQQPDPSLEYRCPPCRQFIAPPPSFLFLFISIPHSSRFLPPDRLRPPFSEQADHALTCFFLETHCLPHSYQPTSTSCLASPRPRFDSSQSYFSACSYVACTYVSTSSLQPPIPYYAYPLLLTCTISLGLVVARLTLPFSSGLPLVIYFGYHVFLSSVTTCKNH
jgi:hypothetical protein